MTFGSAGQRDKFWRRGTSNLGENNSSGEKVRESQSREDIREQLAYTVTQSSLNYGLWVKSSPLPVFVNKVLLEHSPSFVYILCMAKMPELSSCNKDSMAHKA